METLETFARSVPKTRFLKNNVKQLSSSSRMPLLSMETNTTIQNVNTLHPIRKLKYIVTSVAEILWLRPIRIYKVKAALTITVIHL